MRPCLRHFCCVLLFSVLSLPLLAAKIPVGVMRYEGETPDGSSIFHILLNPPAGITFDNLTPSFFTDGNGRSFALPSPQPAPPPLYDFLSHDSGLWLYQLSLPFGDLPVLGTCADQGQLSWGDVCAGPDLGQLS